MSDNDSKVPVDGENGDAKSESAEIAPQQDESSPPSDSPAKDEDEKATVSEENTDPKQKQKKPKSRSGSRFAWLLWILLLVVAIAVGYLYFLLNKQSALVVDSGQKIESELVQMATQVELQSNTETLNGEIAKAQQQRDALIAKVSLIEDRLQSQQSRILAMSTTSRDDWLLAEAEYLLKLANQRVLVERKADTAIGLLKEADNILRDIADPDLFELRGAIKKDLVALKLVEQSDAEGIYLELAALAGQIDALPLVPKAYNYKKADDENTEDESEPAGTSSVSNFFSSLADYVRIVRHSERPAAILPPEESAYLQLNLRLMIEQAQLALLREELKVYQQSLNDASAWLKQYFPSTREADQFIEELERLKSEKIVVELPDISESLAMLKNYISVLHKLDGDKDNLPTKTETN